MEKIFQEMVDRWPSPVVARTAVREFSGGIVNERTLANLDCRGAGPKGRFRIGRKIVYSAVELAAWLEGNATPLAARPVGRNQ